MNDVEHYCPVLLHPISYYGTLYNVTVTHVNLSVCAFQVSVRSTVSEDGSLNRSRLSTPPTTLASFETESEQILAFQNSLLMSPFLFLILIYYDCVHLNRFMSDFDSMEFLGKGASGCVYKVREKILEKNYAVKIVNCEE